MPRIGVQATLCTSSSFTSFARAFAWSISIFEFLNSSTVYMRCDNYFFCLGHIRDRMKLSTAYAHGLCDVCLGFALKA
jgi:hypothetical protein